MGEAAIARDAHAEDGLADRELAVLRFEAAHPRHTPRKDDLIRRELGLSTTRYYRILATLIETRAALQADPMLVGRLRRIQHARAVERSERRALRQEAARDHRPRVTETNPREKTGTA